MNCPHCGAQLVDEARFCGSCGSQLAAPGPGAPPPDALSPPPVRDPRPSAQPTPAPFGPQRGGADVKDPNTALLLELLPGLVMGTYGIGHLYLGRVGRGLLLMFGYWFVAFVNLILASFVIGLCTLPLCHLGMAALSGIWAFNDAKEQAGLR